MLSASRVSVGDAYNCLEYIQIHTLQKLHVVTSDYHVHGTEIIFKKLFTDCVNVKVFGAKTDAIHDDGVFMHEAKSLCAFKHTFSLNNCSDIHSIYHTLSTKYPFYNGKIYPEI